MSDNTAILAGFTKEVMAYSSEHELHLFVKPDADLGERFKAYDADECEFIYVNGWNFSFITIDA